LSSSTAEKYVDEIRHPSTHEVNKVRNGGAVIFDINAQREKEPRSATRLRHPHELIQDMQRRVVGRPRFLTRLPSLPANFSAATCAATSPRTDADATI